MAEKLNLMDQFPDISFTTTNGNKVHLPADINTDFAVVLFYRGHWWPYCRRLLDGYQQHLEKFQALGVSIFAATVDSLEDTQRVAANLTFPVGYGVDRALGDNIGAWWEERRNHIQPSEFLLNNKGRVMSSTYSSSPLGRMDPAETLTLVEFIIQRTKG